MSEQPAKTCPVHGWTLIQKSRSEQHGHLTVMVPIDEWWCRTCGYDTAVPERVELPPVRVRGFDRLFKKLGDVLGE